MAEGESGMAKGRTRRLCKRKPPPRASSVDDGSRSSPQLSDVESTSSKSYVIEWLCAHPYPSTALTFPSPAEDPPSFHDIYHHNLEKVASSNSSRSSFVVSRRRPNSGADIFCHTSTPGLEMEEVPTCWQAHTGGESARPWNLAQSVSAKAPAGLESPGNGLPNGLNNYAQTIRYCNCKQSGVFKHGRRKDSPLAGHPTEMLTNRPGRKENKIGSCEIPGDEGHLSPGDAIKPEPKTAKRPPPEAAGTSDPEAIVTSDPEESQFAKGDLCPTDPGQARRGAAGPKISSTHHKKKSGLDLQLKTLGITVSVGEWRNEASATESAQRASRPGVALGRAENSPHAAAQYHRPAGSPSKATHTKRQETQLTFNLTAGKGLCRKGDDQCRRTDPLPNAQAKMPACSESSGSDSAEASPRCSPEAGTSSQLPGVSEKVTTCQSSPQVLEEHLGPGEVSGSELGISSQHLASADPDLFDQLKLQGAEDRVRLLVALYQQLSPSAPTVKQLLGAGIPLEKMTTDEVCKWLIESGFEAYVPHIREFGITGRQLANTDSELFDQLQLRDAEDREKLLFALYQELNPSDMNVEEILGSSNIDNVFSSVELPMSKSNSKAWASEDLSKEQHSFQDSPR
ncbi:hypothetical protein chiPu_0021600 [Chiloscyllium punctatum]|uniref:SAM domain-containing protein n=1 Tax=Chiloscyllium punctatum TaxID=137246 RepID=A0A401RIG2_CHIPU|nr:hypothetical protein [Chiloscyllium punctatum]